MPPPSSIGRTRYPHSGVLNVAKGSFDVFRRVRHINERTTYIECAFQRNRQKLAVNILSKADEKACERRSGKSRRRGAIDVIQNDKNFFSRTNFEGSLHALFHRAKMNGI